MTVSRPASLRDIREKQVCSTADLERLCKSAFPDGVRSVEDVTALQSINEAFAATSKAWSEFFVDSLTDFIVTYSYPKGSLDDHNAEWLKGTFAPDGVIRTPLELRLIFRIVETSQFVPLSLTVLLLNQLRLAISTGHCAYAEERLSGKGISQQDMSYVLRCTGICDATALQNLRPAEVALMREIDDVSARDENHPGWTQLMGVLNSSSPAGRNEGGSRWLKIGSNMVFDDTNRA